MSKLREAEARAEKAEQAVYDMATSRMTEYVHNFVGFVIEKRAVREQRERAERVEERCKDVADELREAAEGDQVIPDSRRDWYRSLADRLDEVAYQPIATLPSRDERKDV